MDILELLEHAKANGGGTYLVEDWNDYDRYEFKPLTLEEGYYVALPGGIERAPLSLPELEEFLLRFDYDSEKLGLWRDEDGLWSIDCTVWVVHRPTAIALGKLNHQRAIWDIAAGEAITL